MSIVQISQNGAYNLLRRRLHDHTQKVTASLEVSKPKNHLLVLDGVRALACLMVILHHIIGHAALPADWPGSGFWHPSGIIQTLLASILDAGASGIILFFLLSSFLLFLPFSKALLFDGQWPSVSRFYIRRCFRIIPAYYAAVFLMILFFHPEFFDAVHRWQIWEFLTFTMSGNLASQLNGPFWTMAVEFQFYMFLPLIAWILSLIVRRGTLRWRTTKLVSCLLLILGWGLLSRWWGLSIDPSATDFPQRILALLRPYYFSDSGKYYETFAVGMLLALLYVYTQNAPQGETLRIKLERWSFRMFLIALIGLVFLALSNYYITGVDWAVYNPVFAFLDRYSRFVHQIYTQWETICYTICYGLCMYALLYGSGRLKRPFEWPVLRWIGLFSFSLYMWHYPLLFLFADIMSRNSVGWHMPIKFVALLAWTLFVIFPVSLTLYRWIEMPGMRLGEVLVQRIERLKKQQPVNLPKPIDRRETPSTPIEVEIS
ncbi:MAG: acyltransferase [Ktedonobacteraceae bacterium]